MIQRQAGSSADEVLVTFKVPAEGRGKRVSLVGDFNDWSPDSHPMELDDNGAFTVRVALVGERAYRFRYLFDGGRWENDPDADAYPANEFGGDDSMVDLTNMKPADQDNPSPHLA